MLENGLAVGYDDHYEIVDPRDGRLLFDENTPDLLGVPVDFPGGLAWLSTKGKLSGPGWSLELGGIPSGPPSWDVGETSVLFVGTVEGELVAVSVSPKEAGILWRASLPGPVISSPVLGEERVIVGVAAEGDEPGGVVAFDRVGQEVWRFRTGFQPGGSPALGKQVWIADRDGIIYALDPQSGVEQWRLEGVSDCKTTPVWAGNSLYVGFGDGRLIRVDLDDGGKAWSFQGGAPITGDPVVAGGMIVAGSASGRLFAIK
jgi:outer membrane protein assembly factor BamB